VTKYAVVIYGENCVLWDPRSRPHWFYTVRYVTAPNEARAEQLALSLVRSDRRLTCAVRNSTDDPVRLLVEEVEIFDSFPDGIDLLPGFAYCRDDTPLEDVV